jgi:hypothetical protein
LTTFVAQELVKMLTKSGIKVEYDEKTNNDKRQNCLFANALVAKLLSK